MNKVWLLCWLALNLGAQAGWIRDGRQLPAVRVSGYGLRLDDGAVALAPAIPGTIQELGWSLALLSGHALDSYGWAMSDEFEDESGINALASEGYIVAGGSCRNATLGSEVILNVVFRGISVTYAHEPDWNNWLSNVPYEDGMLTGQCFDIGESHYGLISLDNPDRWSVNFHEMPEGGTGYGTWLGWGYVDAPGHVYDWVWHDDANGDSEGSSLGPSAGAQTTMRLVSQIITNTDSSDMARVLVRLGGAPASLQGSVSRDGGTTFTTGVWAIVRDTGVAAIYGFEVSLTGQPADTNLVLKLEADDTAAIEVQAWGVLY